MTQDKPDFHIEAGFPETERDRVAALFWEAFGQKLGTLLGPRERALAFLTPHFDPSHAITAIGPDGQVLGLAGFKTEAGAFAGGETRDVIRSYGMAGMLWRLPFLMMLERSVEPGVLLMDGIAVAPEARGMGLGTALLDAISEEARTRGLRAVRLDVIDSNPRARALYERCGFVAGATEHLGPLRWVFGFSSSTRMERAI